MQYLFAALIPVIAIATAILQTAPVQQPVASSVLAWAEAHPALAAAFIALFGVVLGSFLTVVVWPVAKVAFERSWDCVMTRFSGRAFENRYLDWVIRQHRYLPSLPTTLVPVTSGAHRQELDKLYVSLAIGSDSVEGKEVHLSQLLREGARVVILGEPGAGKTTLLRFLALTLARAKRGRSSVKDREERRRDDARFRHSKAFTQTQLGITTSPFPIFVYLNRFRDISQWDRGRSILDALIEEWRSAELARDLPTDFFERKLNAGQCVFLLDAFDEIGSEDARNEVATRMGELCSSVPDGNRFIVTSRIVGYEGQLAKYGFNPVKIQRLSWGLVGELVRRWYDSLGQPELAQRLLDSLQANPRLFDLAINPMLLSLIVLVQYVRGLIPDKRHILYEECLRILVERRYAPPAVQAEFNKLLPGDEALVLVREVALFMHSNKFREIPRRSLELDVLPRLLREHPLTRAASVDPADILVNIEQRSQLLVERGLDESGDPVMSFSHLTFQEFLTAVAYKVLTLSRGRSTVTEELLEAYERDPEWWEEVLLLFAAQLDSRDQEAFLTQLRSLKPHPNVDL
jgi:predicted NACHT family NTPase